MGVVAGSMEIWDGVVSVVLILQPPRAETLHKRAPEEADQIPVTTIFEYLATTGW